MLVPFDSLSEDSRVWIYQANRSFTEEELQEISSGLDQFIERWTAHGGDLKASYDIKYKRFITIALDQKLNAATGCSIDSSVQFIQQLEKDYNIDLLDKMNVTFKQGDYLSHKNLEDFKKMAKEKAVNKSTIVFNNLVDTKEAYQNFWEVPAEESWHSRFF